MGWEELSHTEEEWKKEGEIIKIASQKQRHLYVYSTTQSNMNILLFSLTNIILLGAFSFSFLCTLHIKTLNIV